LISKKFEKEIVFESSVLAWNRIRNRIRIEQKCWIRIRIRKKSIRIHNPAKINVLFANSFIFIIFIFYFLFAGDEVPSDDEVPQLIRDQPDTSRSTTPV
jgi:hypothetical protein